MHFEDEGFFFFEFNGEGPFIFKLTDPCDAVADDAGEEVDVVFARPLEVVRERDGGEIRREIGFDEERPGVRLEANDQLILRLAEALGDHGARQHREQ